MTTQVVAPAHVAFQLALNEIRNNSTSARVHDATYELEVLSAALWPTDDEVTVSRDRWRSYGLTAMESRMMDLFASKLGKVVSLRSFMAYCYFDRPNGDDVPQEKMFSVKICHVRKKLKNLPYRFTNIWGEGYRMDVKPT